MSISTETPHIVASDDLRHRMARGVKTRDSLFWNLVLPEEDVAVQVYVWIDGEGRAGRQVAVYCSEDEKNVLLNAFDVDLGQESELDDWLCEGLRVRQPVPLTVAELHFDQDDIGLDYRFTARHRPFSYRENPRGCPHWMATNRYEQSGRAEGTLRIGQRVIPFQDVWTHRDHSWGRRHWGWVHHWKWLIAGSASVELNTMFHVARGECGVNGHILRDGEPIPVVEGRHHATYDEDMSQLTLEAEITDATGGVTHLEMERYAIFHMPFNRDSLLSEAACRVKINGEPGVGQFETLWPKSYVERLVAAE